MPASPRLCSRTWRLLGSAGGLEVQVTLEGNSEELTDQTPLIPKLASRNTIDRIAVQVGEDGRRIESFWEQRKSELVRNAREYSAFCLR